MCAHHSDTNAANHSTSTPWYLPRPLAPLLKGLKQETLYRGKDSAANTLHDSAHSGAGVGTVINSEAPGHTALTATPARPVTGREDLQRDQCQTQAPLFQRTADVRLGLPSRNHTRTRDYSLGPEGTRSPVRARTGLHRRVPAAVTRVPVTPSPAAESQCAMKAKTEGGTTESYDNGDFHKRPTATITCSAQTT